MEGKAIAARLRACRGGRSRAEVAAAVGISVSALQMYETGARTPRDAIKRALAEHYHTNVGALFFDEGPHETCGNPGAAAEREGTG